MTEEGRVTLCQPLWGRRRWGAAQGPWPLGLSLVWGEAGHQSGSGPARDLVSPVAGQQRGCSHLQGPTWCHVLRLSRNAQGHRRQGASRDHRASQLRAGTRLPSLLGSPGQDRLWARRVGGRPLGRCLTSPNFHFSPCEVRPRAPTSHVCGENAMQCCRERAQHTPEA